jgi:hypothetical protein
MTYAADTSVTTSKSRQEIERTLARWKASAVMFGWDDDRAIVGFVMRTRQVRFVVRMPSPDEKQFQYTNHSYPRRRTAIQQREAYDQAVRQRWRALNLIIKAKLEAVESGISEFDTEFLAQLVLPNGQTVGESVTPRIIDGIEANEMPALLPDFGPKALEGRND